MGKLPANIKKSSKRRPTSGIRRLLRRVPRRSRSSWSKQSILWLIGLLANPSTLRLDPFDLAMLKRWLAKRASRIPI
jgi:hypothetical protein